MWCRLGRRSITVWVEPLAGAHEGCPALLGSRRCRGAPTCKGILGWVHSRRLLARIWVVVEHACVVFSFDWWEEGRGELLLQKSVPIEVLEPLVLLDVVDAILQVAVPLSQVRSEELLHQALRVFVEHL